MVWTASRALCQGHSAMSPLCLLSSPCWHGSKSPSSQALMGLKPTTLALRFPPPHPGLVSRCPELPLLSHAARDRHSGGNPQRGQPGARPAAEREQAPGLADKGTESREVGKPSVLVPPRVCILHSPLCFCRRPWDGRRQAEPSSSKGSAWVFVPGQIGRMNNTASWGQLCRCP